MALKTITFTVGVDKIEPATIQDGGIQGDHKKTELRFNFDDGLYNHLKDIASNGKFVYRFDATDGEGTVHHSDTAVLTGRRVSYPLEYTVTCHGGLVKVELIISCIKEKIIENEIVEYVTDEVLHTKAAELKLTFAPYSTGDKSQFHKDLSTLAEIVKDYAKRAVKAEEAAANAEENTRQLAALFKNGSTFIFNGGNASGEIDADFIVDGEVSDYSTNAVQNKVMKAYVDSKYPVGSVWVGGKNGDTPIDPSEIFGGKWELIDKEFASSALSDKGTGGLFAKEEIVSGYELLALCSGHTIRLRLGFTPNMVFEDNYGGNEFSKAVGQLELEKLGITTFYHSLVDIVAMSDSSNGLLMAIINTDGLVSISDVIKSNTANEKVLISTEITCRGNDMLDSFCDKFYWQRKE